MFVVGAGVRRMRTGHCGSLRHASGGRILARGLPGLLHLPRPPRPFLFHPLWKNLLPPGLRQVLPSIPSFFSPPPPPPPPPPPSPPNHNNNNNNRIIDTSKEERKERRKGSKEERRRRRSFRRMSCD